MRTDFKISDEQFEKEVGPFYDLIHEYIEKVIFYEYFAYYLSNKYNMNVMWLSSLKVQITSAIDLLCDFDEDEVNLDKLNNILREKYSLVITNINPLEIKKISPTL